MDTISELLIGILTGAVGGIVAGVVLLRFSSNQQKKRESLQRVEQIKCILEIIVNSRAKIFELQENEKTKRLRIYRNFGNELELFLSNRAERLTVTEIQDLKEIFLPDYLRWMQFFNATDEWSREIFRKAELLKWLNLPHEPK